MNNRPPAVAGYFYPNDTASLLRDVDGYLPSLRPQKTVLAAIMPHAGYMYSGSTAGAVAGGISVPNRVILLCPKHTHSGAMGAISKADAWSFPFGDVPVDKDMAARLEASTSLVYDDKAHENEHSLEVEIPFLWRMNPHVQITPIALGLHRLEDLAQLGQRIAATILETPGPKEDASSTLIVASTDMSHQIPIGEAKHLDQLAIDKIVALDPVGLYETVFENQISMCGVIPVTTALFAANQLGAKQADLIQYTTSAEATGDATRVVGYAGLTIT